MEEDDKSCTKIYKISSEDGKFYIGSTKNELRYRLNNHKCQAKIKSNKFYDYMNNLQWKNVKIELMEEVNTNSKKLIIQRINYFINLNIELCLNGIKPATTQYENGKIYKLVCKDGHYYIGSTITELNKRFVCHKHTIKNKLIEGNYSYLYNIPISDINIELIENYPCETKKELLQREELYINKSIGDPLCLNTFHAYQTPEEKKEYDRKYYQNNLEQVKETQKKYYESNKNEIIEQHRVYNELNRDAVNEYHANYRKEHAEQRREYSRQYNKEHVEERKEAKQKYYAENKEKVLESNKAYVVKNSEKVKAYKLEWQRQKTAKESETKRQAREKKKQERIARDEEVHTCSCGGTYQAYRLKRHEASKKHMKFMQKGVPEYAPESIQVI